MKTITISLFILGLSLLCSCNKSTPECSEVNYKQTFKIEEGESYCFTDGNYIEITGLQNGFCPCFAYCIWEGEMLMHYEGEFDGKVISGFIGSSPKTDSILIENKYFVQFGDIVLTSDCTEPDPNPEIDHAYIKINKL